MMADAICDRVDQTGLLLQECSLVGWRSLLRVVDLKQADGSITDHDGRLLLPRRLNEIGRLKRTAINLDPGPADFRVLPSWRDGRDQRPAHRFVVGVVATGQLLDGIEAVEFFRALTRSE